MARPWASQIPPGLAWGRGWAVGSEVPTAAQLDQGFCLCESGVTAPCEVTASWRPPREEGIPQNRLVQEGEVAA